MNDVETKIACLNLAKAGTAEQSLKNAKLYYDWVTGKEETVTPEPDKEEYVDPVTGKKYKHKMSLERAIKKRENSVE